MDGASELSRLRAELDAIDGRLVELLAERGGAVQRIGDVKVGGGALRDRAREGELLGRLTEKARRIGVDPFLVTRIFREILDHSVRMQHERLADHADPARNVATITVVYQGTTGAYSYLAAQRHFGPRAAEVALRGCASFAEMLEAVEAGDATYGVLPVENTTAGTINEAYDLLAKMKLSIVGEEVQRVDHCLLAIRDIPLSQVKRIYSHPKALDQCTEFLRSLTDCHAESYADTAMAAQKVRDDQDLSQAAIASEEAAQLYGLCVIRRSIANQAENYTRFVVVAREPASYDLRIPCKTSLIFATRHEEGALLRALNVLAAHHLNLTKLESRPRPHNPWEYLFYVDFEGNLADEHVRDALRELTAHTGYLRVLGSYPTRTSRDVRPADAPPVASSASGGSELDGRPPDGPASGTRAKPTPASPTKSLDKKTFTLASRGTRAEDTRVRVGDVLVGGIRPVIIAGPCSVESREQIMLCARAVKEHGGDMLRGGCFKPRTSPYAFQGLGYDGLELLWEAGQSFGLPIVTEVMHPADLEAVARRADVIQLGARNMQNFSLLKECGRIDRPIMLKRGMMSSIDEWLAAAEYILAHGNQQVILCERGIRTFETATRSTLDLSAVPVARELTHLPIIVDPSHACGVRRWVPSMSVASLAVGAHGIMIEIHPEPEKALSDGPQALTFDMFRELMQRMPR